MKQNRREVSCFLLLLVVLIAIPMWTQSGATLLATTDLDCNWRLDGQPKGMLKADDAKVVPVSLGKHLVQATSTDGQDEWQTVVNVSQLGQERVEIKLKAVHQQRVADADLEQHPTWIDPATGLMWARKDNGNDVNWNQASNYCATLRLAGNLNWRLPTIDELAAIYDQRQNWYEWHVKGGIRPTGGSWSSTEGNASGQVWSFFFDNGQRVSFILDRRYFTRALCVRRSGE